MLSESMEKTKAALRDAMEQSKASQKALFIEQQKHLDTSNWAMEQQERADVAEAKACKLEAARESDAQIVSDHLGDRNRLLRKIRKLEAVAEYSDHRSTCDKMEHMNNSGFAPKGTKCTCGYEKALADSETQHEQMENEDPPPLPEPPEPSVAIKGTR